MPGFMGILLVNRLMSKQRKQKRRRHIQARSGSLNSLPFKKDSLRQKDASVTSVLFRTDSLGPEDDRPLDVETLASSELKLPEDIWCHIHSLMPLRDSACSAWVSRTFLRSWRCHPKLTFTEETLGLKQKEGPRSDIATEFTRRVDNILKNHSKAGVKSLMLVIRDYHNVSTCHLNNWLKNAITPGIEEVTLSLPIKYRAGYNFPCSLLLDGRGNSIRYLYLTNCAFRPTVGFDCLRSLTKLRLYAVRVTGDELGCLISNSFALEELELRCCMELICLKIPFWLERLSCLAVSECYKLQAIESTAPNLSTFDFSGEPIPLALGKSSQVKTLSIDFSVGPNCVGYAITKLPCIVPRLETLAISSNRERVNTPIVADKFLHLKHLNIYLGGDDDGAVPPTYDYLSLASFLDASPALESFILSVDQFHMKHDSVLGDDASRMRHISGHKHDRLKKVQINGFCSAKSLLELTCHILANTSSLESLTLDTIFCGVTFSNYVRCCAPKPGKCMPKGRNMVLEAHRALDVIKRYIIGRVPSAVKLNIGEPCTLCHAKVP